MIAKVQQNLDVVVVSCEDFRFHLQHPSRLRVTDELDESEPLRELDEITRLGNSSPVSSSSKYWRAASKLWSWHDDCVGETRSGARGRHMSLWIEGVCSLILTGRLRSQCGSCVGARIFVSLGCTRGLWRTCMASRSGSRWY